MALYRNAATETVTLGGGWRVYWRDPDVGGGREEVGDMTDLKETREVNITKLPGSRYATRPTIRTKPSENVSGITLTPITLNSETIRMAAMAAGWTTTNQASASETLASLALADDLYMPISGSDTTTHRDAYTTKISHGTVTGGPYDIGETVTGGTSSATGVIAWVGSGYVELISVSGTFAAGETLTGGTSSASATTTSVQAMADIVLVNSATPTTRYVLGTDYDLDLDAGLVLKHSTGSMGATAYRAYQLPALAIEVAHRDSGAATIVKEVWMEPDAANIGLRMPRYYPRVEFSPTTEWALLTDDDSAASVTFEGTIVQASNKPAGQQYGSLTVVKPA